MLHIRRIDRSTAPLSEHDPITAWKLHTGPAGSLVYDNPDDALPTVYTHDWELIVTSSEDEHG